MSAQPEPKEWIGDKITIRLLPPNEYFRLAFLFGVNGEASLPDPALSRIAVAEDPNGDIIGCFVLQLVAHAEPLWVSEDYRRQGVAFKLVEAINNVADQTGVAYYSFAENDRVASLCAANGMELKPWKVYYRPAGGTD